jgi:hypothetical protein
MGWNDLQPASLLPCEDEKPCHRVKPRERMRGMIEEAKADAGPPTGHGVIGATAVGTRISRVGHGSPGPLARVIGPCASGSDNDKQREDHHEESAASVDAPTTGSAPYAVAAEVRPGDHVRFIERDQHIPAHPGPVDTRVHLRFISGSEATVLQVSTATGWIEVRGEPLQGGEHTGWIAPRFLAGPPNGGEPVPDTLAWCPPKGSPRMGVWSKRLCSAQTVSPP